MVFSGPHLVGKTTLNQKLLTATQPFQYLNHDRTTMMLAEFDAETHFRLRAARGEGKESVGLQLLDWAMTP